MTANGNYSPESIFVVEVERRLDGLKEEVFRGNLELVSSRSNYISVPDFDALQFSIKYSSDDSYKIAEFNRSDWNGVDWVHVHVVAKRNYLPSESEINKELGIDIDDPGQDIREVYNINVKDIEIRTVPEGWSLF